MAKQQNSGGAAKVVETLVRPTIEGMGLRLWDVRFEKEGPDWFLRVLVDRDEPLDTDTCEAVSRAIDPLLDEADPIEQSYYLEVGSPGLGRRLTRPRTLRGPARAEMRGPSDPPRRSGPPRRQRHPAGPGRGGQRHPAGRADPLHLPAQSGGVCQTVR